MPDHHDHPEPTDADDPPVRSVDEAARGQHKLEFNSRRGPVRLAPGITLAESPVAAGSF